MTLKTLHDLDLAGKTVLMRADINVPFKDRQVSDHTRIDRLKDSVDFITGSGAKLIVMAHLGRPKGAQDTDLSMEFLAPVLQERWGVRVTFSPHTIGEEAEKLAAGLQAGEGLLLENLRFHEGEKSNDPAFAQSLARLADIYVNDGFSVSHRAHASTSAITAHLPSAAGILMAGELQALNRALENPDRPVMAVVGGAKISTKLDVLKNLCGKVDYLVPGGGMANTFLHARGINVGKSLCEADMTENVREIENMAERHKCEIILPRDVVCADNLEAGTPFEICTAGSIPPDKMALDAGPDTVAHILKILQDCKTLVWNGPLGVFEVPPFDKGTKELAAKAAALSVSGELVSVAGGGDTVAALEATGTADDFSYVSTAGGAFLEWLEGRDLPGVKALMQNDKAA